MECPGDPKEAKPKAAQTAAASTGGWRWLARTGQSPAGGHLPSTVGRVESRIERVWFGLAADIPTKNNRGVWVGVNDMWASAAENAGGTVRPEKSCEGPNPMSGAGWRATIQRPPSRPGGEKIARAETGTPGANDHSGECLKDLAIRRFERRRMHPIA
jgi:hypothetical protein